MIDNRPIIRTLVVYFPTVDILFVCGIIHEITEYIRGPSMVAVPVSQTRNFVLSFLMFPLKMKTCLEKISNAFIYPFIHLSTLVELVAQIPQVRIQTQVLDSDLLTVPERRMGIRSKMLDRRR